MAQSYTSQFSHYPAQKYLHIGSQLETASKSLGFPPAESAMLSATFLCYTRLELNIKGKAHHGVLVPKGVLPEAS